MLLGHNDFRMTKKQNFSFSEDSEKQECEADIISGFFSTAAKKTPGRINSKLKQKTQRFGKFWWNLLQKSTEMTKNKRETTQITKSRLKRS